MDLRSVIEKFKDLGMIVLEEAETPIWRISPKLWAEDDALFFSNIKGYPFPIVGNLCNSREKLAASMGVPADELLREYVKRAGAPHAPVTVATGPVKDVIYTGDNVDMSIFPVLLQHERDGAPYISSAVDFARNDKGGHNVGIRRLMFLSKDEITFNATSPSDLKALIGKSREEKRPFEIAFAVGAHPLVYLGALTRVPVNDELSLIGGLFQRALNTVKCETVDILVPADAEMIIEGLVYPDELVNEGPYGEVLGFYGESKVNARMEITAVTHRKDMIFQTLTAGGDHIWNTDGAMLSGLRAELSVWNALKQAVAKPINVFSVPAAGGQLTVRASIDAQNEGDGKNALLAVLSCLSNVKCAIITDKDVNIFDGRQVDHEIATKVQPSEDVMIINNVRAISVDPSLSGRPAPLAGSKMGIDATASKKLPASTLEHSKPPFSDIYLNDGNPCQGGSELAGKELEDAIYEFVVSSENGACMFTQIWKNMFSSEYREILSAISRLYKAGKLSKDKAGRFVSKL